MKTVTILKTPKVPIVEENFIYNYYSDNEENINDKKFLIFGDEDPSYALRTRDATSLTRPRFISFNLMPVL